MSGTIATRRSWARPSLETVLFASLALGAVLVIALRLPAPPLPVQAATLGVLVATLGLPHGALDPLIARRAGLWRRPIALAAFNAGYIAMVGLVVGIWLVAPTGSLIAFLVVSGIHFGADWNNGRGFAVRALTGVALLSLPAFSHHTEVASIYRTLAGSGGDHVADAQAVIGPVAIVIMLVGAALALRKKPTDALEILLAATLALIASPLIFFALYFCGLHSARHLRHGFADERGSGKLAVAITVVYTVVPIAAVGILIAIFGRDFAPGGALASESILRLVFIGLAALTVPHMTVLAIAEVRSRRGDRQSALQA